MSDKTDIKWECGLLLSVVYPTSIEINIFIVNNSKTKTTTEDLRSTWKSQSSVQKEVAKKVGYKKLLEIFIGL